MLSKYSWCLCWATLFLAFIAVVPPVRAESENKPTNLISIDASIPALPLETGFLHMGGKSSSGHEIAVNHRYLTLDGRPWLPVMGEFHFSRFPEKYWEEEILKMRAGGIQIISTYIFWIHHEEVEGQFDWSGQRDLRHFAELCAKHGMYLFVRIGPWAHGEVRNGGFPDWLLKKGPTRRNDPTYLLYVQRFYGEIGKQLQGLLWKNGGPVIGIQLENEYDEHGPGAGAEHIAALKKLALQAGLEVPLYTVTGWPSLDFPPGEVIPAFGGYADGFWWGSLKELPANDIYLFNLRRDSGHSPPYEQFNLPDPRLTRYPYFIAEGGGGMETAYHRRPLISPDDVAASSLTHIGSGANLYGYYMYHGGANPEGKLSTLQESSATDYPNDLPIISYDFQAPLGEFGQVRPSLNRLRPLHLFLQDFGANLAPMIATLPANIPTSPADSGPSRVALRSDGKHGFLFLNNYLRNYPLPGRRGFQVSIKLPSQTVTVPSKPIDVPPGAYFIWPINLDLKGINLEYATAQLVCQLEPTGATYYFFSALPGVAPEFAFEDGTFGSLSAPQAAVSRKGRATYVTGISPGTDIAITLNPRQPKPVHIVVLSPEQAQSLWKTSFGGKEYIFLSPSDIFFDETSLHLRSRDVAKLRFGVFPDLGVVSGSSVPVKKVGREGLFQEYESSVVPRTLTARLEAERTDAVPCPPKMGKPVAWRGNISVATPPDNSECANSWQIILPNNLLDGLSDAFLRIHYAGDMGQLYAGPRLLDDDFYKGTVWEVGLKRFAGEIARGPLELKVWPLRKDAPIYLPARAWPDFERASAVGKVQQIEVSPEYEVDVALAPHDPGH